MSNEDDKKIKTLEAIKRDIEEIEVTKNEVENSDYSDSKKGEMTKQLDEILEKLKKEEREKHAAIEEKGINKHNWGSTRYLWKPKKKSACRIRIMPWPENSEAKW